MDLLLFLIVIALSSCLMSVLYVEHANSNQLLRTDKVANSSQHIIIFLAALLPALLVGLRGMDVGSDTDGTAYAFYKQYIQLQDKLPAELFYCLVSRVGYMLLGGYNGMLFAVAFVTLLFAYYAFAQYRHHLNPGLATFVYLCLMLAPMCNIVRQSMATAICLYGMKYIHEKKLVRYVLITVLAMFAHTSAIVMLLFYPFYHFVLNTRSNLLRMAVSVLALSSPMWISEIYSMAILLPIFSGYDKYEQMIGTRDVAVHNFTVRYLLYLVILIPVVRSMWLNRKKSKELFAFHFYPLLEAVSIISTGQFVWAFRLMYYFTPAYALLAPYLIAKMSKNHKIIFTALLLAWGLSYFYVFHYLWGNDAVFPYKAFFIREVLGS